MDSIKSLLDRLNYLENEITLTKKTKKNLESILESQNYNNSGQAKTLSSITNFLYSKILLLLICIIIIIIVINYLIFR